MLLMAAASAIQQSVEADLLVASMIDRIEDMTCDVTELDAEVAYLRDQLRAAVNSEQPVDLL